MKTFRESSTIYYSEDLQSKLIKKIYSLLNKNEIEVNSSINCQFKSLNILIFNEFDELLSEIIIESFGSSITLFDGYLSVKYNLENILCINSLSKDDCNKKIVMTSSDKRIESFISLTINYIYDNNISNKKGYSIDIDFLFNKIAVVVDVNFFYSILVLFDNNLVQKTQNLFMIHSAVATRDKKAESSTNFLLKLHFNDFLLEYPDFLSKEDKLFISIIDFNIQNGNSNKENTLDDIIISLSNFSIYSYIKEHQYICSNANAIMKYNIRQSKVHLKFNSINFTVNQLQVLLLLSIYKHNHKFISPITSYAKKLLLYSKKTKRADRDSNPIDLTVFFEDLKIYIYESDKGNEYPLKLDLLNENNRIAIFNIKNIFIKMNVSSKIMVKIQLKEFIGELFSRTNVVEDLLQFIHFGSNSKPVFILDLNYEKLQNILMIDCCISDLMFKPSILITDLCEWIYNIGNEYSNINILKNSMEYTTKTNTFNFQDINYKFSLSVNSATMIYFENIFIKSNSYCSKFSIVANVNKSINGDYLISGCSQDIAFYRINNIVKNTYVINDSIVNDYAFKFKINVTSDVKIIFSLTSDNTLNLKISYLTLKSLNKIMNNASNIIEEIQKKTNRNSSDSIISKNKTIKNKADIKSISGISQLNSFTCLFIMDNGELIYPFLSFHMSPVYINKYEKKHIEIVTEFSFYYYNLKLSIWEPFIEPLNITIEYLSRVYNQTETSEINIESDQIMNLNLTYSALQSLILLNNQIHNDKVKDSDNFESYIEIENKLKELITIDYNNIESLDVKYYSENKNITYVEYKGEIMIFYFIYRNIYLISLNDYIQNNLPYPYCFNKLDIDNTRKNSIIYVDEIHNKQYTIAFFTFSDYEYWLNISINKLDDSNCTDKHKIFSKNIELLPYEVSQLDISAYSLSIEYSDSYIQRIVDIEINNCRYPFNIDICGTFSYISDLFYVSVERTLEKKKIIFHSNICIINKCDNKLFIKSDLSDINVKEVEINDKFYLPVISIDGKVKIMSDKFGEYIISIEEIIEILKSTTNVKITVETSAGYITMITRKKIVNDYQNSAKTHYLYEILIFPALFISNCTFETFTLNIKSANHGYLEELNKKSILSLYQIENILNYKEIYISYESKYFKTLNSVVNIGDNIDTIYLLAFTDVNKVEKSIFKIKFNHFENNPTEMTIYSDFYILNLTNIPLYIGTDCFRTLLAPEKLELKTKQDADTMSESQENISELCYLKNSSIFLSSTMRMTDENIFETIIINAPKKIKINKDQSIVGTVTLHQEYNTTLKIIPLVPYSYIYNRTQNILYCRTNSQTIHLNIDNYVPLYHEIVDFSIGCDKIYFSPTISSDNTIFPLAIYDRTANQIRDINFSKNENRGCQILVIEEIDENHTSYIIKNSTLDYKISVYQKSTDSKLTRSVLPLKSTNFAWADIDKEKILVMRFDNIYDEEIIEEFEFNWKNPNKNMLIRVNDRVVKIISKCREFKFQVKITNQSYLITPENIELHTVQDQSKVYRVKHSQLSSTSEKYELLLKQMKGYKFEVENTINREDSYIGVSIESIESPDRSNRSILLYLNEISDLNIIMSLSKMNEYLPITNPITINYRSFIDIIIMPFKEGRRIECSNMELDRVHSITLHYSNCNVKCKVVIGNSKKDISQIHQNNYYRTRAIDIEKTIESIIEKTKKIKKILFNVSQSSSNKNLDNFVFKIEDAILEYSEPIDAIIFHNNKYYPMGSSTFSKIPNRVINEYKLKLPFNYGFSFIDIEDEIMITSVSSLFREYPNFCIGSKIKQIYSQNSKVIIKNSEEFQDILNKNYQIELVLELPRLQLKNRHTWDKELSMPLSLEEAGDIYLLLFNDKEEESVNNCIFNTSGKEVELFILRDEYNRHKLIGGLKIDLSLEDTKLSSIIRKDGSSISICYEYKRVFNEMLKCSKIKLFLQGIGISIINYQPKELFFITLQNFTIMYDQNKEKKNYVDINIDNLQIDDSYPDADYKTILFSDKPEQTINFKFIGYSLGSIETLEIGMNTLFIYVHMNMVERLIMIFNEFSKDMEEYKILNTKTTFIENHPSFSK